VNPQVSGTVTLNGLALPNVAMAAGGGPTCTTTNNAGQYSCTVPFGWSGSVTPTAPGYSFAPASRSFTGVSSTQSAQTFTATLDTATAPLYFVEVDHLNTPRLVANDAQQAVWRWDQQEPFGVNPPDENPSSLGVFDFPLRFTGQYFDKESNLTYNYRRTYNSALGRFVEADPAGLSGGINPFEYTGSDPLGFIDPLGQQRTVATTPASTPLSNAYGAYLVGQIQRINPTFQYQTLSAPGQGGYNAQSVQYLNQVLQQLRSATAWVNCPYPVMYGPLSPGPLAPNLASTFRSGTYFGGTLNQAQTMYRVIAPGQNPAGAWWTTAPPSGPTSSIVSLALKPQWGNTATQVVTATIPPGTTVYFGVAAPQGGLVGGGNQVYIPQLNPNWINSTGSCCQ
jgi:RHS repeat-associated protein